MPMLLNICAKCNFRIINTKSAYKCVVCHLCLSCIATDDIETESLREEKELTKKRKKKNSLSGIRTRVSVQKPTYTYSDSDSD